MDALVQAVAEFVVADLDLVAEPAAVAAAQRSLTESGLLLLGEVHGARENPLLARTLMQAFGLTGLGLEWDEELAPVVEAFLATSTLADHRLLWPDHRWAPGGPGRTRRGRATGSDLVRRRHRRRPELV